MEESSVAVGRNLTSSRLCHEQNTRNYKSHCLRCAFEGLVVATLKPRTSSCNRTSRLSKMHHHLTATLNLSYNHLIETTSFFLFQEVQLIRLVSIALSLTLVSAKVSAASAG